MARKKTAQKGGKRPQSRKGKSTRKRPSGTGTSSSRKTVAERIADTPLEIAAKMDVNKLREQVKKLQYGYNRRVASFNKKGLSSFAQIAFENSKGSGTINIDTAGRNRLLLEFGRYKGFFSSKTSNEKGIKFINKQQDVMLFGADSRGNPLSTMTEDERKEFWKTYNEFKNQNPGKVNSMYGSGRTMQVLIDIMKSDNMPLAEKLKLAQERLEKSRLDDLRNDKPNVYSGRRNN